MAIQHIVIDLETMSTKPTAAIVSIGAVRLDAGFNLTKDPYFYERVSLESSMDCGLSVDAGTILFWMQQCHAARQAVTAEGSLQLHPAIWKLHAFMTQLPGEVHVWGYGPEFDNVVLTNAFNVVGARLPWHYRNNRSLRELRHLYPNVSVPREGTFHNALDDAKRQAQMLREIMRVRATTVPGDWYEAAKDVAAAYRDFLKVTDVQAPADLTHCTTQEGRRRILAAEEKLDAMTVFTDMM